jgi:hypothetical protein
VGIVVVHDQRSHGESLVQSVFLSGSQAIVYQTAKQVQQFVQSAFVDGLAMRYFFRMPGRRDELMITVAAVVCFASVAAAGGRFDEETHGTAGGAFGYAYHHTLYTALDATSGATSASDREDRRQSGAAVSLFADLGLFGLGPGTVGLRADGSFTAPGPYYAVSAMPRYRLEIPYDGEVVRSLDPWIGVGIAGVFPEALHGDGFLVLALSVGLDFEVVSEDAMVGLRLDMNKFTILGTTAALAPGAAARYDAVMSNIDLLVVVGRRFY